MAELSKGKEGESIPCIIDAYPVKPVTGPREEYRGSFWQKVAMFCFWMWIKKGYYVPESRQMLIDGKWIIPGNIKYFSRMVSEKIRRMRLFEAFWDGSLKRELDRMRRESPFGS